MGSSGLILEYPLQIIFQVDQTFPLPVFPGTTAALPTGFGAPLSLQFTGWIYGGGGCVCDKDEGSAECSAGTVLGNNFNNFGECSILDI